jgi:hypothetical protein
MECSCGAPDVTVPYCNVLGPVGVRLADLATSLVAVRIERDAARAWQRNIMATPLWEERKEALDAAGRMAKQASTAEAERDAALQRVAVERSRLRTERDALREALQEAVYELDGRVDEGTALQVEHGRAVVQRLRAVLAENEEGTGGYRRARGSMPWIDSDEPAESSVRRLRGHDAEGYRETAREALKGSEG